MDSPQPTPDPRSAVPESGRYDPWLTHPGDGPGGPGGDEPREPRAWGREIADALLVGVPVAVFTGVALALLWVWRAPRIPLVLRGEDVLLANSEGQQAIGADGVFLLLGLGVGAVAGLVTFLARRSGGVAVVVGLALGAGCGAWLAWQFGMVLGPTDDVVGRIPELEQQEVFDAPLELGARSVLLGVPFGALLAHLLCVAGFGPRDGGARPLPPRSSWETPSGPAAG